MVVDAVQYQSYLFINQAPETHKITSGKPYEQLTQL